MERALGLGSTCVSNSAPDKRKPIVPYPTEFTLVLRWKRERHFWTLFPIPLFETRRTNWKRCELDNIYQSEVTPRGKVNFAFIFSFRGSFHFFHRKKQDRSFFSLDWLIEGSESIACTIDHQVCVARLQALSNRDRSIGHVRPRKQRSINEWRIRRVYVRVENTKFWALIQK